MFCEVMIMYTAANSGSFFTAVNKSLEEQKFYLLKEIFAKDKNEYFKTLTLVNKLPDFIRNKFVASKEMPTIITDVQIKIDEAVNKYTQSFVDRHIKKYHKFDAAQHYGVILAEIAQAVEKAEDDRFGLGRHELTTRIMQALKKMVTSKDKSELQGILTEINKGKSSMGKSIELTPLSFQP